MFIIHLKRLFPRAQDQEEYFKSAELHKSQIIEYLHVQLNKTVHTYFN